MPSEEINVRGGARRKACYTAWKSGQNAGASQQAGCKRQLAAISDHQVDKTSWKEIFGAVDEDSTTSELIDIKRVGVVGLHDSLASELVDCFAAKPSVVSVGVHLRLDGTCSRFDIMPGVTSLPTPRDVCAWSDIIFLCGSYQDANTFLYTQGVQRALMGKVVLQLTSGTPEEAVTASNVAESAGARYLDVIVFSEGTANVFNHRLSAMMVSGDRGAWREVETVVRTAAPASFYGGRRVEWANTLGVGVVTFLASVCMGVKQAENITTGFGLPPHVLARVLSSGYMHVVKYIVASAVADSSQHSNLRLASDTSLQNSSSLQHFPAGSADANTFSYGHGVNDDMLRRRSATASALASSMHAMHGIASTARSQSAAASGVTATAPVGSTAWVSQLVRIREVCRKAHVDHSLIDGFLAVSGSSPHHQQTQLHARVHSPARLPASGISKPARADRATLEVVEEPLENVFGHGGVPEALDFNIQEVLMDIAIVEDDVFRAS